MDANNEAEFGALRRILQLSADAFSLTLATCGSPRLRESLFARLREENVAFREIALALGCTDPVAEVRKSAEADMSEASVPIFVTGLDYLLAESTPGADALLAVFNRSRERWRDAFRKRPLVFWVSEHATTRLMAHSPDFRAWVSHELEFREEEISAPTPGRIDQGALSRNYLWLSNLDAAGKRARLAELERRLSAEPPEPALLQAWARAWDEKITLVSALGELDEAARQARALLRHYPAENEATLIWRAETFASLADILSQRGQYDEALRILREEQLPVYERLDAIRDIAVTRGKIADILTRRGQFDEALRIRREEEMPVYERLGAIREIAVTRGQIADILKQHGQYDEALRILREEVLPVFERLGAVREIAVTKGKIADILARRGQYDEALRIRREEVLPVYERLGALREIAATKGRIADILTHRGQFDEVLRIRREEELPVYERLGAVREIAVCRANIAVALVRRGKAEDAQEAGRNLILAWLTAKNLGLPEAEQVEQIAERAGWPREQFIEAARKFAENSARETQGPREKREGAE